MAEAGTTVRGLLVRPDFRRLLGTRLLSQFGDGVFQAALAGTVLFNPQRAADPVDVAAGFAVLLLPYSLVGPFAGVWLDRWSRRQVLLRANVLRAGLVAVVAALVLAGVQGPAFYAAGLAVFSVNRFILAALSAGLPHTTDEASLVSANAVSTTSGAVATVAGGGAALGLLQWTGSDDAGYAALALTAALPYLAAAVVVAGFSRGHLGPDHMARSARLSAGQVLAGMASGARHAWQHRPAAAALTAISLHRIWYGFLTLMALLLYRNTFVEASGPFPGGLVGLGLVVAAGAVGTLTAAAVTPAAVHRIGKAGWIGLLLATGGVAQVGLWLLLQPPAAVAAGFVLGFMGQGVKICVDTTLQECIDDDHRGRVFSVYDTLVNVGYVVALMAGAFVLPASGVSRPLLLVVGVGYVATAVLHGRMVRR
ncbi:MFS transporter [Blastococcus saxobsidens]|uniref:Major Facilitator Superfamily transporter n=1 Tax=Blastococcus saxobsidens (strain DD2) TaxID=1146883 RepID=H6RW00_BLASD|nr:MFS transporter [Blastococcus saxobsidens]CCG05830.1 Major Facilitator Superfamily transporter [Blastococcus saxobsidens DD2]